MSYANSIWGVVGGFAFPFLAARLARAAREPFWGEITPQLANPP